MGLRPAFYVYIGCWWTVIWVSGILNLIEFEVKSDEAHFRTEAGYMSLLSFVFEILVWFLVEEGRVGALTNWLTLIEYRELIWNLTDSGIQLQRCSGIFLLFLFYFFLECLNNIVVEIWVDDFWRVHHTRAIYGLMASGTKNPTNENWQQYARIAGWHSGRMDGHMDGSMVEWMDGMDAHSIRKVQRRRNSC